MNDHFEISLESVLYSLSALMVRYFNHRIPFKISYQHMLGTSIPVHQMNGCGAVGDAAAHSVNEYSKDSSNIVTDYALPLYFVSVSLTMTCFCLIGRELLQVAKIPAPLWQKECLSAFISIEGIYPRCFYLDNAVKCKG